jgi:hypothetical protein
VGAPDAADLLVLAVHQPMERRRPMTEQRPSVGRIVHYVSYGTPGGEYGKECRAAIVTEVPERVENPQTLGLCVLNPTGMFFNRTNPYDSGRVLADEPPTHLCDTKEHNGGTWHWPERV